MVELHADLVLFGEKLAAGEVVAVLGCEALEHIVTSPTAGAIEHFAHLPWRYCKNRTFAPAFG